jgi:hypothetical protein
VLQHLQPSTIIDARGAGEAGLYIDDADAVHCQAVPAVAAPQ